MDQGEIRREFDEFIGSYKISPVWWMSSLIGAIFATTIGTTDEIALKVLAFSIFVVPALVYYWWYRPFGLKCDYIQLADDPPEEYENPCFPVDEEYTILLHMKTGANVTDYRLDIHLPPSVELKGLDGVTSSLDKERQILYGITDPTEETYTEALYLKKSGAIPPDGDLVLLKNQGTSNTKESVRLLPRED